MTWDRIQFLLLDLGHLREKKPPCFAVPVIMSFFMVITRSQLEQDLISLQ